MKNSKTDKIEPPVDERVAALEREVNRYRLLAKISADWFWQTDENYVITDMSEEVVRITGKPREHYIGQSRFDLGTEELKQTENWRRHVARVKAREPVRNFEYGHRDADGNVFFLRVNAMPRFDGDGVFTGYLGSTTDITEIVRAKEAAQHANQAKSEFLSAMSHELRTPLNAVLGFAQLLELNSSGNLSKGQQDIAQHIVSGGMHLLALINDVLDLAKIESQRMTLDVERLNPVEVAERSLDLVRSLADSSGVKLMPFQDSGGIQDILADERRLQQVLLNLLSNAIKYNRRGGKVTLVVESPAPSRVRFRVIDDGPGIQPLQQAKLFEPFERLGAERGEVEGSGIGLTITKALVEQMGGRIGLTSAVGKGSDFHADFPSVPRVASDEPVNADTPDVAAIIAEISRHGAKRVLYVEDNATDMAVMKQIFGLVPTLILQCETTAAAGLADASISEFDLVLLDLHMPETGGLELCRQLRSLDGLSDTPIIAVSAAAGAAEIDGALESGFDGFITKPVIVTDLLKTIGDVF